MSAAHYMAAAAVGLAVLAVASGWWRLVFLPFRLDPKKLTVERLGLHFASPDDATRVNDIFAAFVGGFNAMITRPSPDAWRRFSNSLPCLYRPFAHEGAAMGYCLRRLRPFRPDDFEEYLVAAHPAYSYLHYVGLGFWSGLRNHKAGQLQRIVDGLDPLHRYLCYDGYGFKHVFFAPLDDGAGLAPLEKLEGYAKNAAYQGVGRALWFRFAPRSESLIEHILSLRQYAADAAAGVGLAAAFVNPDRLNVPCELALRMPRSLREVFHLGMCFGLKARHRCDPAQFARDLANTAQSMRDAVMAAMDACDRIEGQVRACGLGYREWRMRVSDWMRDNIPYPIGHKHGAAAAEEVGGMVTEVCTSV